MGSLSVASSLDLVLVASGEGNGENSHEVAVVSLGLNESLNEGVPFLDKRAELVTGDVHTVEVGVAVETFDFLDLDLNLSPRGLVSLVVELTKRGKDLLAPSSEPKQRAYVGSYLCIVLWNCSVS